MLFANMDFYQLAKIAIDCSLAINSKCFAARDFENFLGAVEELERRGYKIAGSGRKMKFFFPKPKPHGG